MYRGLQMEESYHDIWNTEEEWREARLGWSAPARTCQASWALVREEFQCWGIGRVKLSEAPI